MNSFNNTLFTLIIIEFPCILFLFVYLIQQRKIIRCLKKKHKKLYNEKQQAIESNQLKTAFLANMSHEIRTPLNAVVGFSTVLADVSKDEGNQEFVHYIEQNNSLLLQLIDDILDISKIEAGVLDFSYTTFELEELMIEIRNMMKYKSENRGLPLNLETPQEKLTIHCDRKRLTQVLINLLTNAFKFTTNGEITFGYRNTKDRLLYFYVTDNGCGISQQNQKNIFERFVRLDTSIHGTGLGLPICKLIIDKMRGTIGVDSELGKGSTFWFTIPRDQII